MKGMEPFASQSAAAGALPTLFAAAASTAEGGAMYGTVSMNSNSAGLGQDCSSCF
jgi:hypothetical protein